MKILLILGMAIMLMGTVMAGPTECGNNGFNCECKNFYNDDHYYTIAKFAFDGTNYEQTEINSLYSYFAITVDGNLKAADWTSTPIVYSVLVKAGNARTAFPGGTIGSVNSVKDISHITFCGYKSNNGGCTNGNCNGVPEFSIITITLAIFATTMGLIYFRKK